MSPLRLLALTIALIVACDPGDPDDEPTPRRVLEPTMSPSHAPIPVEEVVRLPRPGMTHPTAFAFTPDDQRVTFLDSADDSMHRQLYQWDPDTGETVRVVDPPGGGVSDEGLSLEEQLRRERMRERGHGITRYWWSDEGGRILVPLRSSAWVQDGVDGTLREVAAGGTHPVQDPQLSPDGQALAWVQDDELYVADLTDGQARQLTQGARGTGRTNGLAEFIAQEEMGRHHGFWWSTDATRLAFVEVDETHIPVWRIVHEGKDEPTWEDHRYPFAGAANARVRLGVVPATGGSTVWMDLTAGGAIEVEYLARVHWLPDGGLVAEVQNRAQTQLDLVRLDPTTGTGRVLLTETSETWVNLHKDFRALASGGFLWASERTGFKHLYLLHPDGTVAQPLTEGDWTVDAVVGLSEAEGMVWFTGARDGVLQRHLYRVPLAGGEIEKITEANGQHSVILDHGHARFVDVHHSLHQPPRITLRRLDNGSEIAVLHTSDDPRVEALALTPPELIDVTTRDGVRLDAALYRPAGEGPHPLLVHVYGGPHAQMVSDSWALTVDMRDQWLRSQGWMVVRIDNRGATRRGLAFEGALHWNMGEIEVRDQEDGVRQLISEGLVDPERVGIFGWSYGGYLSAMALARAPETFKAAVAGAPVTHWDGYDTHYTERYMGTPQANPEGYRRSSVMHHVASIEGELLLVHGMIDENVHFRHTARLMNALIAAGQRAELLPFPDERHVPRDDEGRIYMEETLKAFFERTLSASAPEGHRDP